MRRVAYWFVLTLIFVIPWENAVVLEGVGTLSRIVGLFAAVAWAVSAAYSRELRRPVSFHALIGLFVVWGALTGLWTIDETASVEALMTNVQLVALAIILWDLLRRRTDVEAGLQAYALGAWVCATSLLVNYSTVVAEGASPEDLAERFTAIGFNANDVAIIMALGLPVAWYLAIFAGSRSAVLTVINVTYLPVASLGILLTGSRAALVAALAAALFMLASLVRLTNTWRLVFVAGAVGVVVTAQAVVPPTTMERLRNTPAVVAEGDPGQAGIGEIPTRAGGRSAIWDEGIALFLEAPIGGFGTGTFAVAATAEEQSAHNGWLAVLVENGLVGFIFFLGIQVVVVWEALRQPLWTRALWLTVLVGLAVGILTHNWEQRKQTWLFLSLVVGSAAVPMTDRQRCTTSRRRPSSKWRATPTKMRERRRLSVERRRQRYAAASNRRV